MNMRIKIVLQLFVIIFVLLVALVKVFSEDNLDPTIQYNQSGTLVITGNNTTSTNFLNAQDSQYFNTTEYALTESNLSSDLQAGTIQDIASYVYNWTSSDQEAGTQRFITTANAPARTANITPNNWISDGGSGWANASNVTLLDNRNATSGARYVGEDWYNFSTGIPNNATVYGIMLTARQIRNGTATTIVWNISNNGGNTWQSFGSTALTAAWVNTSYGSWTNSYGNINGTYINISAGYTAGSYLMFKSNMTSAGGKAMVDWMAAAVNYSTPKLENNTSWTSPYSSIGGSNYQNVDKIGAIITISTYNPAGSNTTYDNNIRPDIEVGFYNGTTYINGSYCQANNTMGMNLLNTTAWNCSINTTSAQFLNSWKFTGNRSVIIRGVWLDAYNSTRYDEVNVTGVYGYVDAYNGTNDLEANETATVYGNILPGNFYENINNITVTVNVSSYNKAGSTQKGNSNPDLWLEVSPDGGTSWRDVGNFSVNAPGNFSESTQDSTVLNGWETAGNRFIRIKGRYFDGYNQLAYDEINFTDVWVQVDSSNNYSAEIEHNATVSYPNNLNNINVSVNFTSNVSSIFNLTLYNFSAGAWDYSVCQNGATIANTWYNWWCNVTTNPMNYNSSVGVVRLRLNETNHPSPGLIREDYVQYYVSYTNNPPTLGDAYESPASTVTYSPGASYTFNITVNDQQYVTDISTVLFELSETNYTSATFSNFNSTARNYSITKTDLAASTTGYAIKWYANDSQNAWGNVVSRTYIINKDTPSLSITFLPSNPATYPASTTATCNKLSGDTSATLTLFRNGSQVAQGTGSSILETNNFGVGVWNYSCNYSASANYTDANIIDRNLQINKGDPTSNLNIYIDGVANNKTITYPATSNISANETNTGDSDCTYTLYRNDTALVNGNNAWNVTSLGNGTYAFKYNMSGTCSNWTLGSSPTLYLYVNQGTTTATLYLNNSQAGQTSTYLNSTVNATATSSLAGLYVQLWRNGTLIDNVTSTSWNVTQWGAYNNNFSAQVLGNQNYSSSPLVTLWWNVSKGATSIRLYINGSENNVSFIVYDVGNFTTSLNVSSKTVYIQSNMGGWTLQSGTTPLYNYTLLSLKGLFNITGYFPGDENYTGSSNTYYANVRDLQEPSWSSQGENSTLIGVNDTLLIYANWSDNYDLDYAWLSTNESGQWRNVSFAKLNLTTGQTWSNFSWRNNSVLAGSTVAWKIYANDTSDNENATDVLTFFVNASEYWRFPSTGTIDSSAAIGNINGGSTLDVVFGSLDNNVYALSGSNGSKIWNFLTGDYVWSSPSLANITGINYLDVIIGSFDDNMYDLNGTNGNKIWNFSTGDIVASSPSIVDTNKDGFLDVVFGSFDNNVYDLNASNGIKMWNYSTGGSIYSSPSVENITVGGYPIVFVGSHDNNMYALNGSNGNKMWNFSTGDRIESSPAIGDINNDGFLEVAFGSVDSNVYVLNASNGAELWNYSTNDWVLSSPVIAQIGDRKKLIVCSVNSSIYALNPDSSLNWTFNIPTGGRIESSPSIADMNGDGVNDVVVGSSDGKVYALNGIDGILLWSYNIGEYIFSSPSLADINSDGNLEVLIGSRNKNEYALDPPSWSMFGGNQRRTRIVDNSGPDALSYGYEFNDTHLIVYSEWRDAFSNLAMASITETGSGVNETYLMKGVEDWANFTISKNDIIRNWGNQGTKSFDFVIEAYDEYENPTTIEVPISVSLSDIDKEPPYWSNENQPENVTYDNSSDYVFGINWFDNVGIDSVIIENNFLGDAKNYTVINSSENGYTYAFSGMKAGSYYLRWYARDISGNWNSTDTLSFIVSKIQRTCALSTDKGWTRAYDGTPSSTECSIDAGTSDGTMIFNVNSNQMISPDIQTNAGTYYYSCQWIGTNYSDCSVNNTLTISNVSSNCSITGITNHNYGTPDIVSCSCTGDGSTHLYRNDILHDEWNNVLVTYEYGTFDWVCNKTEGTNYNSSSASEVQAIDKASSSISVNLSPSSPVSYPTVTTASCSRMSGDSSSVLTLYRNGNQVATGSSSPQFETTTLGLGTYNYTCTIDETQNYTSGSSLSNYLTFIDSTPPQYSNAVTGPTSPTAYSLNAAYQLNITWIDNVGVDKVILEFNRKNYTDFVNDGNVYYRTFRGLAAGTYQYKWYANDVTGNWNFTDTLSFTVSKSALQTTLYIDGKDQDSIHHYGDVANVTTLTNAGNRQVEIWSNLTNSFSLFNHGKEPLQSMINLKYTPGIYNLIGMFEGDENYTYDDDSHLMTVIGYSMISNLDSRLLAYTNQPINVDCRVKDANTGIPINKYPVSFYLNNMVGGNTTNSNGLSYYSFKIPRMGIYLISCSIGNNRTIFYDATQSNSKTGIIIVL